MKERKIDYWKTNEVRNLKKITNPQTSIYYRIICLFMFFIEIQPLYCFRGKMCRKLEKCVGVCITLTPNYQYRLSINRRVWGFGLKEDKNGIAQRRSQKWLTMSVGGHRHLQIGRMFDIDLISEPPTPLPPRCTYPKCGNLCGQRGRKRFIASWGLRMSHICACTPWPSPQGYRSKVESRHFAHHWSVPRLGACGESTKFITIITTIHLNKVEHS